MNIALWLIVILPIFSAIFYNLLYPIGVFSAVIEDGFDLFSFFGVDCALLGKLSAMFSSFLLGLLVLYIYNKIKS